MIDSAYVRTMARYNAWQNDSLIAAAEGLDDAARRLDRGAFFGSIQRTFSHLLWADETWLGRLIGSAKPGAGARDSAGYVADWPDFVARRRACDQLMLDWAESVSPDWLEGTLSWYSGAAGRDLDKPRSFVVVHMFNHQTHHRGQIHAMLTAAGARPQDTDLLLVDEPRRGG